MPLFTAVALAGVLSGAVMLIFSAALIHLLLLRCRAKQQARASQRLIALDGHHGATSSSSDSDLGSLEAAEGGEEKGSRLSLNLTPNQPIFVDIDAVYGGAAAGGGNGRAGGGGAQAGLQLLLTPPTPRRVNREIP
jgi:hypothetical protein